MFESSVSAVGKARRLRNIFRDDDRALIVAMDHGAFGSFAGLEKIEKVVEKVVSGGAEGILVTPAMAKHLTNRIKNRIPMVVSIPYDDKYVEHAVKLGAEAVKTTYFGPVPLDHKMLESIWNVSAACEEWGMPYMVEIVPCDESGKTIYEVEKVKLAARTGAELGGDLVKTAYVGPSSKFKEVVESTPIPITVMGGPKMDTITEVLTMLKDAVDAGACGGTIGRNIWQHPNPDKIVKALSAILHEGKTVAEAQRLLH